ncbi:phosphoribosylformylglycinamidine synthase [Flammeovirga pectinis]|uniref:Phosphoribosylformylglycinamidine synthase n=1 Tax=Flammeovirga pectinis TaxID=2494373 RepID=A0A3S9P9B9_9BACT|nr:HAEPLYID family protein [Flammeovirga pectinis]AZQ64808.1 phosphoribosylformylglycinamidine synthase [Flammeovirga pectinis]
MRFLFILSSLCLVSFTVFSQNEKREINHLKDSIYIEEYEENKLPVKVLHAEPLYIDLIRDLGARKGEKEWNVGMEIVDNLKYDKYETLVEYEWAPINRLGFEVELPFVFYAPQEGVERDSIPSDKLESLKLATQWTFFVHEKMAMSMAIGYINEIVFSDFRHWGDPLVKGNVYNPFFVIAKRWGSNFHSLLYTGPKIEQTYASKSWSTSMEINPSVHYMIPGTSNFIGVEFNQSIEQGDFDMTIRPQMRVGIMENLLVGIVAGIPVARENERLSAFCRLIWEPQPKH